MADPDDFNELFKFVNSRKSAVHNDPSNDYAQFINVYTFINSDAKRQDAVKSGQDVWKGWKATKNVSDLYSICTEVPS